MLVSPGRYTARHSATSSSPARHEQPQYPLTLMSNSPTPIDADYTRGAGAHVGLRGHSTNESGVLAPPLSLKRGVAVLVAASVVVAALIPLDGTVATFAERL